MSDFHRSLDRAINCPCDYWAIDETTAYDSHDPLPRDTGIVDNYDPHTDWGVQGHLMADLLAARHLMADQPARYDIRYREPEIVRAPLDTEIMFADIQSPSIIEKILEAERFWVRTFLAGVDCDPMVVGTPLADQEIPAEGVE